MNITDQIVSAEPRDASAAEAQARKFQRELGAGLTSLVLLSVLAEAGEDLYGYEIARRLTDGRTRRRRGRPVRLWCCSRRR